MEYQEELNTQLAKWPFIKERLQLGSTTGMQWMQPCFASTYKASYCAIQ